MNAVMSHPKATLGELEWKVVDMARQDGPRSLNPEGLFVQLSRDLFGLPVARQLANKGLEALRRFCVRAWYWDAVRLRDVRALIDAGYSKSDVRRVLAHIASHRGFAPSVLQRST